MAQPTNFGEHVDYVKQKLGNETSSPQVKQQQKNTTLADPYNTAVQPSKETVALTSQPIQNLSKYAQIQTTIPVSVANLLISPSTTSTGNISSTTTSAAHLQYSPILPQIPTYTVPIYQSPIQNGSISKTNMSPQLQNQDIESLVQRILSDKKAKEMSS